MTIYEATYMIPGKDHRKKPGKATFRGKGMGMKCTSIRYYGTRAVPFTPPDGVMDALNGITRAFQAIGRTLCDGDPPSKQVVRPAILLTAPHYIVDKYVGRIGYMGDKCRDPKRCHPCKAIINDVAA